MDSTTEIYVAHALEAVVSASSAIMEVYKQPFEKILKNDGSPVTQADLKSSGIIHNILKTTNLPITGEEVTKADYSIRKDWNLHWCVDPLDGTKEFIKKNGEFVVCIALIEQQQPVLGVIASPVAEKILIGGKRLGGAYFISFKEVADRKRWKKLPHLNTLNDPLVVVSSRSHYSGDSLSFLNKLKEQSPEIATAQMGSALKFFDLAQGKADVYPRFAPTMEWDIAAGQAIYEVLGGKVLNAVTRAPLVYNKENLKNPHFVIAKPGVVW